MVMSGGGQGDPRDDDTVAEQAVVVDYSFQNHSEALLRKGRHAGSNFRNCQFAGADLRGIRGKYAIWQGSDWWNAVMDDELRKALAKKWPQPTA